MDLSVEYEDGTVIGTVLVDYINATDFSQSELVFRLHPNATHIYGSASLRVLTATAGGAPADPLLFVEDTVLVVPLAEPLAPGGATSIGITFQATASSRSSRPQGDLFDYGIFTKTDRSLVLTSFYPILVPYTDEGWTVDAPLPFGDALTAEAASYDVRLTVASDLLPIATGTLVETSPGPESTMYRYTIDRARDFSIVLGTELREQSASIRATALRTWYTAEHAAAAQRALEVAAASLDLYALLIAPSPFDEIDIVEVPLNRVAGVEFSGLILVSSEYAAQPSATFYDIIISHEMAHQWFYAGVGNDPIAAPWLDESLATYLSYIFLEATARPGTADGEMAAWRRAYERARAEHPDLAIDRPLSDFPDSSTYSAFVYSGGAVLLDAIRREIGDTAFFAALAAYYEQYEHDLATGDALLTAFEEACACSLTSIRSDFGLVP